MKNIICESNKIYELILALHVAYIEKYPEVKEDYDFIEIPPINYVNEIKKAINIDNYTEIIRYLKSYTDEAVPINIAIGIDNDYELNLSKMDLEFIEKHLGFGTIHEFVRLLKAVANDIDWDSLYNNNQKIYECLLKNNCKFPEKLSLEDVNIFYGIKSFKYNFIISVLMNGGFGPSDKNNNIYYVKGFKYNEVSSSFESDDEYLLECMFHEFSHPIVNPIVDKFFDKFEIDKLYNEAIIYGLPKTYQNKKTFLYEYFVRVNAYCLLKKYYPNAAIDEWVVNIGFKYINELSDYVFANIYKYKNYEDMVENSLIDYINNIDKNM